MRYLLHVIALSAIVTTACSRGGGQPAAAIPGAGEAATVTAVTVAETPVARFIRVSGTLSAQEQADVAAEVAGRVVATPIERGSHVSSGGTLIQIADAEVAAQAREADANAAQIEARLGTASMGEGFDAERVAEVASAKANYELVRTEFDRVSMLQKRQLVSRAEYDQKEAQLEAARRQYEVARNGAEQQYQALMGARARVAMAKKALADTIVRSPFDGVVGERMVSVGAYVTKGTKVASVMRVSPLRLELTIPAQYVTAVAAGNTVNLEVDAYPNERFAGEVRYVSPALRADTRALIVEAIVVNADGRLKPGLFATARIEQAVKSPALLIPASAVQKTATANRVFVVNGDHAEERLITLGQAEGDRIEAVSGLVKGDRVVVGGHEKLKDGALVRVGS